MPYDTPMQRILVWGANWFLHKNFRQKDEFILKKKVSNSYEYLKNILKLINYSSKLIIHPDKLLFNSIRIENLVTLTIRGCQVSHNIFFCVKIDDLPDSPIYHLTLNLKRKKIYYFL